MNSVVTHLLKSVKNSIYFVVSGLVYGVLGLYLTLGMFLLRIRITGLLTLLVKFNSLAGKVGV